VGVYRVRIKTSAAKELAAISLEADRRRIVDRIEGLATNPRPPGCQKLAGAPDRYRVRQGRFRVLYSIDDRVRSVVVFRIGDRKSVYR
jgi:mRNA interferase RelE/StbE